MCRQGEQPDVSPDKKKVVFKKLVEKDIETRRNKIKVRSLCQSLNENIAYSRSCLALTSCRLSPVALASTRWASSWGWEAGRL